MTSHGRAGSGVQLFAPSKRTLTVGALLLAGGGLAGGLATDGATGGADDPQDAAKTDATSHTGMS